ncbi:ester cyclase [Nocardioides mesophilus]|uniref:Ester cyclase n=1 Tax=Nocardioides mesophilus TaxID=433659 RepID=A0A7G9RDM9_9ACTN|nr:ester cyclase [Nocardioides mesophilus]QNN53704.1 ester cyclase [Nocardioides mesophilus]
MVEQAARSPVMVATEIFDALKRHDLDGMQLLAHDDVDDHFVAVGHFRGRKQVREFFDELLGAVPDLDIEVLEMVGDDRRAVVQWQATGTFTGTSFQGVHATGRGVDLLGCDVMTFEDGKLRRNTIYYDGLTFARQIGFLPREGSAADKAMTAAFNASVDVRARLRKQHEAPAKKDVA